MTIKKVEQEFKETELFKTGTFLYIEIILLFEFS